MFWLTWEKCVSNRWSLSAPKTELWQKVKVTKSKHIKDFFIIYHDRDTQSANLWGNPLCQTTEWHLNNSWMVKKGWKMRQEGTYLLPKGNKAYSRFLTVQSFVLIQTQVYMIQTHIGLKRTNCLIICLITDSSVHDPNMYQVEENRLFDHLSHYRLGCAWSKHMKDSKEHRLLGQNNMHIVFCLNKQHSFGPIYVFGSCFRMLTVLLQIFFLFFLQVCMVTKKSTKCHSWLLP